MPQIYAIIGPDYVNKIIPELKILDRAFSKAIVDVLGEEVKEDVVFTAVSAVYTRGEADLQIEIRLTTGRDEYNTGHIFNPTQEDWKNISERFANIARKLPIRSFSVWPKPYREAEFMLFEFGKS